MNAVTGQVDCWALPALLLSEEFFAGNFEAPLFAVELLERVGGARDALDQFDEDGRLVARRRRRRVGARRIAPVQRRSPHGGLLLREFSESGRAGCAPMLVLSLGRIALFDELRDLSDNGNATYQAQGCLVRENPA
jgi:hypothetical protein